MAINNIKLHTIDQDTKDELVTFLKALEQGFNPEIEDRIDFTQ